ncbi:MAG: hypothetical protein ACRDZ8_20040, partial [Acidimicrobiales bacterium]
LETFADRGLGLVDAGVVAVAERLGITAIATLNHRDFTVVRPPAYRRLRAAPRNLRPGRRPACDTGGGANHRRDRPPPPLHLPDTRVSNSYFIARDLKGLPASTYPGDGRRHRGATHRHDSRGSVRREKIDPFA